MFKVSLACYCHTHVVLLAEVDAVLVVDAAAGMGHGHDAGLVGYLHAVGEGEEGVAGHDGTVEVEVEALGFGDGLAQGVDAAGLARAAGVELTALGEHDGVALGVFDEDGGEGQVFGLLFRYLGAGDALQHLFGGGHHGVAVLDQHAVEHGAEHRVGHLEAFALEDDAVLFASQHLEGVVGIVGGDADLEENLMHLVGHLFGHLLVADEHTAEGADGVAGQGVLPGLEQGGAHGHAAGVVVLEDGEGGLSRKVVDKGAGGVDVAQVVIADFLAVELVEATLQVAVEDTLLVGVLAVAQGSGEWRVESGENRTAPVVLRSPFSVLHFHEVGVDGGVVMRADAEGVGREAVALLEGGAAVLLLVELQKFGVVVHGGHDDHVVEVLGGGADEADASDVDFLNDVLLRGTAGHGLLEGVEVDDDEVDLRNFVFGQLLAVAVHVAAREDASEHLGVQRFDAAAKDGGIAREAFHGDGFDAEVVDEFVGAAGGVDGHSLGVECANDVLQAVLVEDRDEG